MSQAYKGRETHFNGVRQARISSESLLSLKNHKTSMALSILEKPLNRVQSHLTFQSHLHHPKKTAIFHLGPVRIPQICWPLPTCTFTLIAEHSHRIPYMIRHDLSRRNSPFPTPANVHHLRFRPCTHHTSKLFKGMIQAFAVSSFLEARTPHLQQRMQIHRPNLSRGGLTH